MQQTLRELDLAPSAALLIVPTVTSGNMQGQRCLAIYPEEIKTFYTVLSFLFLIGSQAHTNTSVATSWFSFIFSPLFWVWNWVWTYFSASPPRVTQPTAPTQPTNQPTSQGYN